MSRYYIYDSVTDSVAEFSGKKGIGNLFKAKSQAGQMFRDRVKKGAQSVGKQASLRGQQALGLATSAPGLAALGTAGVAGGAYALNKRGKKKAEEAKQKRSIKGRIKSLLGR